MNTTIFISALPISNNETYVRLLTHLCLGSHFWDLGKHCGPRSAASDQCLQCLHTGISIKKKQNEKVPDTPKIGNGHIQMIKVEESTRFMWINELGSNDRVKLI